MFSSAIASQPFSNATASEGIQARLARVRNAVEQSAGARSTPVCRFGNGHHSDWGGFTNCGEIAK